MNFYEDIAQYSDRIALISDDGEKYTYNQLIKVADEKVELVEPRTVVFLICENSFECIAVYIGLLRKRAVPVLIGYKTDKDVLETLKSKYRPEYIFCPQISDYDSNKNTNPVYQCIKTEFTEKYSVNDELAVLITTSGSTGSPKLVMQSYRNIESNAVSISEYLNITEEDVALTTMPMNYSYGLSIIHSHLLMGASIVTTEKTLMDRDFWSLIPENNVTTFGGVPYIYQMLKRLRFGNMNLPSLRYITQAGGKLSKELSLEFADICREKGIKFIVMYGQTEATARMSYLPWKYAFDKAGSIGIAVPGGKFSLIDTDGTEINVSEKTGELVYEGPNVTLGYAESADDLARTDQFKGKLLTGDMAMRDKDGFYYITGRKKRFLKIFGNRVNLDEIESMLNSHEFECVCSGNDDSLKIYMVNADDEKLKNAVEFISEKTRLNRSAFKTICIKEIPRNASGKVLYSELEDIR